MLVLADKLNRCTKFEISDFFPVSNAEVLYNLMKQLKNLKHLVLNNYLLHTIYT